MAALTVTQWAYAQTVASVQPVRQNQSLNPSNAKEVTVSGRVTNENSEALPGVSVVVKGTTSGTVTNAEGRYTLGSVPENGTLVFSFIGYVTEEVAVANRTTIDITMAPDGYGTQKRTDVTGSIGSVDIKTLKDVPIQTADQALQGRVAGVDVQANSGLPGAGMKINIRGTGTINSTEPLYVIDGFYPANINSINPNDIASIDILKDASASAIYGVLGANGVVIITTKRAKAGKPSIVFDAYYGSQSPIRYLDLLGNRDFATVSNNAKDNALAQNNAGNFLSGRPGNILPLGADRVPSLRDLNNLPRYTEFNTDGVAGQPINTDWQRALFRSAPLSNYNLTVSGGNENSRILASVGYLKQEGIVPNTDFQRISARINGDVEYRRFKMGTSLFFAEERRNAGTGAGGTTGFGGSQLTSVYRAVPTLAIYNTAPRYIGGFNSVESVRDGNDIGNPLIGPSLNDQTRVAYKGIGTFFVEYEILTGLKYRMNGGVNLDFGYSKDYFPVYFGSDRDNRPEAELFEYQGRSFGWLFDNTLSYDKKIGKHSVSALVGTAALRSNFVGFGAGKRGFPPGDLIRVADVSTNVPTGYGGSEFRSAQFGILGRINYEYDGKYLATVNLRRDGSSRFASQYRYQLFPSFSLGWRLSEEGFMKNIPIISDAKLRFGWGQVGNQAIRDYAYTSLINLNPRYLLGQSTVSTGGTITDLANESVQWETTTQTNIGLDLGLLDGRLQVTADYFNKVTNDILFPVALRPSSGIDGLPLANVGQVFNRGFELGANYQQSLGNLNLTFGGNFTFIRNRVTRMNADDAVLPGGRDNSNDGRFLTRMVVGQPIGVFYGLVVDKIYENNSEIYYLDAQDGNSASSFGGSAIRPGDIKYKDLNNDGQITDADRTYIGSPLPDFTYGFYTRAEYKGFDLSLQFYGLYGSEIFNAARYWSEGMQRNFNYDSNTLNRWVSEANPGNGRVPRANSNDANNGLVSNRYIEDGSFLRLRNLTLGYNFSQTIKTKLGNMSNLRLYVTMNNLLTFTRYTGYDPEVGVSYAPTGDQNTPDVASKPSLNRNIDNAAYPQVRSFMVGVQVGF